MKRRIFLLLLLLLPMVAYSQGTSPIVVAVSQPVVTNPINNQYVVQPPGTNLVVNNMICTGSCIGFGGGGGGGDGGVGVVSVGLLLPNIFNIVLSPITSSGNLTAVLANENVNSVFAGPCAGSATTPSFRSLCAADIPNNTASTTGTAGNVTGVVAIVNGGTGTTTPGLVQGTGISITGSWPNQTINALRVGTGAASQLAVYGAGNVLSGDPNITDTGSLITLTGAVYLASVTASSYLCTDSSSHISTCGPFLAGVGAQLTAASTITITNAVHHVTGATPIGTISPSQPAGTKLTLIPDDASGQSTTTGGNIMLGSSLVQNKALELTYDGINWYPSY